MTTAVLLSALVLVQMTASGADLGKGGLTRALSDSFGQKLQLLEKFERDPKAKRSAVSVSEAELNSYVRFALAERVPRGLREIRVVVRDGRLELRGLANLSEFGDLKENAAGAASLLSLLGGEVPVEAVASFKSDRGFGQFEVLSAQVGPVPLSPGVVADIVARATQDPNRPAGFDIRSPFRLPYSAKRIRATPMVAIIEF